MPGDTAVIRPSASIDVEAILGAEAPQLLGHECKTIPKSTLHLPGPDHVEQIWLASDRPIRVLSSLQTHARPRPPRAARATSRSCPWIRGSSTPPARRSRRTPRTSIPRTSSSWRSRAAATPWPRRSACSAIVAPEIRAPDSVPAQAQSQRVPVVPEQLRPDQLRERQAGVRHGRDGRRRDDLLRFGGIEAADPGSHRDVPARPRARHVHRALVLPAGTRPSRRRTPTTTWPRISPARRTISA